MGNCAGKNVGKSDFDKKLDFSGGSVCLINDKGMWDKKISEATKDGKIVVANFSASWCDPCRTISPLFVELSTKYPSLVFLTVDVDELADLGTTLDIRATPTFFFFKDGQQLDKVVGANKAELEKKLSMFANSSTLHSQ